MVADQSATSVAIPSLFGKPSSPTILLEPLRIEQPLRKIENSGWRELSRRWRALQKWLRAVKSAIARAVEPLDGLMP